MATGRKRIKLENVRFGQCVVVERADYIGNNLQYKAKCDCGEFFTSSAQQFRSGLTLMCPKCRKRKTRESREVERLKRIEKININAEKYILMNRKKSQIIRGRNGIHSYFSKAKARLAARVIGNAVAVPLNEAIGLCRE
jgi:hypothetical protein